MLGITHQLAFGNHVTICMKCEEEDPNLEGVPGSWEYRGVSAGMHVIDRCEHPRHLIIANPEIQRNHESHKHREIPRGKISYL